MAQEIKKWTIAESYTINGERQSNLYYRDSALEAEALVLELESEHSQIGSKSSTTTIVHYPSVHQN